MHERIGLPSRCTVHAPHNAMPQPNLVPVMPRLSRKTQSSGVLGSTSTPRFLPLISRSIIGSPPGNESYSGTNTHRCCGHGRDREAVDPIQLLCALHTHLFI